MNYSKRIFSSMFKAPTNCIKYELVEFMNKGNTIFIFQFLKVSDGKQNIIIALENTKCVYIFRVWCPLKK